MNLDALVAPLRADVVSGAAVVARTAAEVVRRIAVRAPASDAAELRSILGTAATRILDAQPAMAPLVALSREVLESVEGYGSLEDARREAARAAESFRGSLDRCTREAGRHAARALPSDGTILTLSSSSSVREAIRQRRQDGTPTVICLESRPMNEGRAIATALARDGIPVLFAVDAAADRLVPTVDAVLIGADSIGDRGVVNKIGSGAVARMARRAGVPVLVTADSTKLLPPGFPQPVEDDRPPDEVWRAPPGVRVWNRYFEVVSLDDVTSVITDRGPLSPDGVAEERSRITVPPELRRWAEARSGSGVEEPADGSGV